MTTTNKLLSIIIVSFNTCDILRKCLNRVREYGAEIDLETFVVDNASNDGSSNMVAKEFPEVKLIASSENLGFAAGNNLALRRASGRFFLLLNSDAYLLPDTLESTIKFMEENPSCGVLGVKLIGEDGKLQPSARMLPNAWFKFLVISGIASKFPNSRALGGPDYSWWDHSDIREVGWVPGAYFLTRKEVTDKVGFLDERYFLYYEETDFCLQTKKAGRQVIFYPHAKVIHLGGESSKTTKKRMSSTGKQLIHIRIKSELRYYRKNFGLRRMLSAADVEIFWQSIVWIKNALIRGKKSDIKREDAAITINLIFKTLLKDHFGKGIIP
ncbi:MAG: glycosyltransferase family 2 protein [Thermodesulfobacteriota bacterium]|nr:glycosyltransferase family 2 protein [Thermodesulfobacteriota bacterium]